MQECGADGYLTFFGVLEIYAREFSTKDDWKLSTTRSYLKRKLCKRQDTLVMKSLKHIQNSGKWDVKINGDEISIFIPKFRELLDESTLKKFREKEQSFRNHSGDVPKKFRLDKDKEKDIPPTPQTGDDFDAFWKAYPKKVGKLNAKKAWAKAKTKPDLPTLLSAIEKQKQSINWTKDNGQYIPNPATWINGGRWDDEVEAVCKADW